MNKKDIIQTLGISMAMVMVIIGLIYKFEFSIMYLSNSIFVVGIILFFIGLISVTGANEIFESFKYTTKKIFARDTTKVFKTFGEYKEHKNLLAKNKYSNNKEKIRLILGGIYLIIGIIMGYI